MSRRAVGLVSLVISLATAACQSQTDLRPDPAVAARWAAEEARNAPRYARERAVAEMTVEKAAAIEYDLRTNPADLDKLEILLEYYRQAYARSEPQKYADLKRPHALWLIEHVPDSKTTWQWARFAPREKTGDLAGYEAGRKLWLANLQQPNVSARSLRNAARFFQEWDVPKAEEVLLRGQTEKLADPDDAAHTWPGVLAELYANVVSADLSAVPIFRKPPYDEHAYAVDVRKKLGESNDVELLTSIAERFVSVMTYRSSGERSLELRRIGLASLDRALLLDPQNAVAKQIKARVPTLERDARLAKFLIANPGSTTQEEFAALTDADKFYVLPRMAKWMEKKGDEPSWAQARGYAEDALAFAPKLGNDPDYSSTVFTAHMTLGLLDIRANARESAAMHLLAAAEVPSWPDTTISELETSVLLVALLKNNNRTAAIEFLEALAKLSTSPSDRTWLLESAGQIRKGLMPEWYQLMIKGR